MKTLIAAISLLLLSVSLQAAGQWFGDRSAALIGIILVVVFGKMRGNLSARYEQLELKKMQSMDV